MRKYVERITSDVLDAGRDGRLVKWTCRHLIDVWVGKASSSGECEWYEDEGESSMSAAGACVKYVGVRELMVESM